MPVPKQRSGLVSSVARVLMVAAWSLCTTEMAAAHHGFGNFQLNRSIEFSGTIKRFDFINPHAYLYVDAIASDGKTLSYKCEMRGATVLRHSGWSKEFFVVGEKITVQAAPDRTSPTFCYVNTLVLAKGMRLDRYGQHAVENAAGPPRPAGKSDGKSAIAGVWAAEQYVMTDPRGIGGGFLPASRLRQFASGEVPPGRLGAVQSTNPLQMVKDFYQLASGAVSLRDSNPFIGNPFKLTAAGRAAAPADASKLPALNCQFTSIVFDWAWENQANRISVSDGEVVLEYGQYGFLRTIHLDQSAHPATVEPSRAGHSIGHWQGNTLVVDTVGFAPGLLSGGPGGIIPHSAQLHVVERFDYDAAQRTLTRHYVAEDPAYLAAPYTGSDVVRPTALPFMPDECNDTSPIGTRGVR
jgi:Family of unknown function (DUF6152)